MGITRRQVVLAAYDYSTGLWIGHDTFHHYGQHAELLITHWMLLPALPPACTLHDLGADDPDFISIDTPMRVVFEQVARDDKALQTALRRKISFTGLQGTSVQTGGALKDDRYFIDFFVEDPIHLRNVKAAITELGLLHVIASRNDFQRQRIN